MAERRCCGGVAQLRREAWHACASVQVLIALFHIVRVAGGTVLTIVDVTSGEEHRAVGAAERGRARAAVVGDEIFARGTVRACVELDTLVNLLRTLQTTISFRAFARVTCHVIHACGTVRTGIGCALVDVNRTVHSCKERFWSILSH